ncbi:D-mannonate dehydratase ManD [Propionibacteriaceae bacterium Y2011]
MKISDARVVVSSPGRNYVTLVIETGDGVIGVGDATLNGRELAVAAYLRDHVCPLLIDRDARRITDTWEYLYRGAYWRRGPVTMTAIAAVDMALWDIVGKSAGLPVHQLLGGAVRDGVMVYGHASGTDLDALEADFSAHVDQGYLAVRAQCAIPGLDSTYGVSKSGAYEPAGGSLPAQDVWDTGLYLDFAPKMMARIRDSFGDRVHLLHDVHHRLSPIEAARLGRSLEPYRMFWMEDPTPAEDQSAFKIIREATTTPIAVGEVFNSIWDCQELITNRWIDYIRTSVTHAGGITHLRRIFSLAELYGVRTGSHGPSDLSPIAFAAALHLDLTVPNFGIQEHMNHPAGAEQVFDTSAEFRDGYFHPGDEPGLGVTFDEEAAARFPYNRKYLPVNRRLDGSVHDW